MKSDSTSLFGVLALIALVIAAGIGWVLNIVALAHATSIDGMVILRAIGIFVAPMGAVMGYV